MLKDSKENTPCIWSMYILKGENSGGGGGGRGAAAFDLLHCVGNLKMRKQKYQRQAFHAILQLLRWRKLFVKDILFQDNPISDHTPSSAIALQTAPKP